MRKIKEFCLILILTLFACLCIFKMFPDDQAAEKANIEQHCMQAYTDRESVDACIDNMENR